MWGANSVVVDEARVYLTDWYFGLLALDVSSPAAPTVVGDIELSTPRTVEVASGVAYVATGEAGLAVVSIAEDGQLEQVNAYLPDSLVLDVSVLSDLLLVVDWSSGLHILDIGDPANPSPLSFVDITYPSLVVGDAGRAFVYGDGSKILILDMTDPVHPSVVGSFQDSEAVTSLSVSEKLLYATTDNSGLRVFDVQNASAVEFLGAFEAPTNAHDVFVSGDVAYVADALGGVRIYDVGEPDTPQWSGTYRTLGACVGVQVESGLTFRGYPPRSAMRSSHGRETEGAFVVEGAVAFSGGGA